jgi:hypothetical protein
MKLNQLKKFEPFERKSIVDSFEAVLEEAPLKILYDKDKEYLTYLVEVEDPPNQKSLYERIMELGDIQEVVTSSFVESYSKISYDLTRSGFNIGMIVVGDINYVCHLNDYFIEPVFSIFGVKIEVLPELSPETVLLLVTDKKNPELPDYKAVIKVTLT